MVRRLEARSTFEMFQFHYTINNHPFVDFWDDSLASAWIPDLLVHDERLQSTIFPAGDQTGSHAQAITGYESVHVAKHESDWDDPSSAQELPAFGHSEVVQSINESLDGIQCAPTSDGDVLKSSKDASLEHDVLCSSAIAAFPSHGYVLSLDDKVVG